MSIRFFGSIVGLCLLCPCGTAICGPFPGPNPNKLLTIAEKYNELGGLGGFGAPLGTEQQDGKGGKYREYENGTIYWSSSVGAHEVHGDILVKYKYLGESGSKLGYPTSDEVKVDKAAAGACDAGAYSMFENGVILWTANNAKRKSPDGVPPKFTAFEVHGNVLDEYKQLGAYSSVLCYPITDQRTEADKKGVSNLFEHGGIYAKSDTALAHEVHGRIFSKYSEFGATSSDLKYPTSDESTAAGNAGGKFSTFDGGVIYWKMATDAHVVWGVILKTWQSAGAETSEYGYPTSDEFTVPVSNCKRSVFEKFAIDYCAGTVKKKVPLYTDLAALDWCYDLSGGDIVFRAVVANVGTQTVTGPGNFEIAMLTAPHMNDHPSQIPATYTLGVGKTATDFGEPLRVPFGQNQRYEDGFYHFDIGEYAKYKNNNTLKLFTAGGDPSTGQTGSWIVNSSGKKCLY